MVQRKKGAYIALYVITTSPLQDWYFTQGFGVYGVVVSCGCPQGMFVR